MKRTMVATMVWVDLDGQDPEGRVQLHPQPHCPLGPFRPIGDHPGRERRWKTNRMAYGSPAAGSEPRYSSGRR